MDFIYNIIYKTTQLLAFKWKYSIIKKHYQSGTLLDIGGGRGEFCNFMNSKIFQSTLYDYNENLLQFNQSLISTNNLETIEDNSTNVITLWHSLEHIHDLNDIFNHIKRILSPDGILVIAVPNVNAYDQKIFKKKWAPYDAPRHLYHFSVYTLTKFLDKFNFKILEKHKMLQDTPYNVLLSIKGNIILKVIKTIIISFKSIIKSLWNYNEASTILFICKQK